MGTISVLCYLSVQLFIYLINLKSIIMKLFKKKAEKPTAKATITKLDKNQLETVIGGATEGTPIGGIIVKGGGAGNHGGGVY